MKERISRRRLIVGAGTASASAALLRAPAVGAQTPVQEGQVVPIFPVRLFDSRTDTALIGGRKLQPGDRVSIIAGRAEIGLAIALFGNLTVTETEGAGYLVLVPSDFREDPPAPVHSNVNWWQSDLTMANSFLSQIGGEQSIDIICRGGRTHVVIDAFGYIPFTA